MTGDRRFSVRLRVLTLRHVVCGCQRFAIISWFGLSVPVLVCLCCFVLCFVMFCEVVLVNMTVQRNDDWWTD